MNVEEYLRVINGIEEGAELDPDKLGTVGFVEIVPKVGDIPCLSQSKVGLSIEDGKITASRTFDTQFGKIPLEKRTALSDDISLHCGENGTPERLLERTITALEEIQSRGIRNFQPQIDVLSYAKDTYEQAHNNTMSTSSKK